MKQLIPNFESISYLVAKIKEYISKEFESLSPLKNDKELVKLLNMPVDLQYYSVSEYTSNTAEHLRTKWVNLITQRGCEGIFTYNGHPIFGVSHDNGTKYYITVMENGSDNNISLRQLTLTGGCLVDGNKRSYIYFVNFPSGNSSTIIYYFDFDNSYSHDDLIETDGKIIFTGREISNGSAKMFYESSSSLVKNPSEYTSKRYCYDIGESIMMYSSKNIYDSDILNKKIRFDDFLIKTPITISDSEQIEINDTYNTLYTSYILRTSTTNTNIVKNGSYYITTETYLYTSLQEAEVDREYYNDIHITYTYKTGNDIVNTIELNYTVESIVNGSLCDGTQPMTITYDNKTYYFSGKIVKNRDIYNFDEVEIKYYTN